MNYELIYDAVSTSTAPYTILTAGLGLLTVGGLWTAKLKWGGDALHWGAKFFLGAGILILMISGLSRYEQYRIGQRTDAQTIEGMVSGYWTKVERTKNASNTYNSSTWEGFSVNGVAFSYRLGDEQNYFHNSGKRAIEMRDGLQLRIRYLPDGPNMNRIVRIERGI